VVREVSDFSRKSFIIFDTSPLQQNSSFILEELLAGSFVIVFYFLGTNAVMVYLRSKSKLKCRHSKVGQPRKLSKLEKCEKSCTKFEGFACNGFAVFTNTLKQLDLTLLMLGQCCVMVGFELQGEIK
jgi:hypothetical protein